MSLPELMAALIGAINQLNTSIGGIAAFSDSLEPFLFGLSGIVCAGLLIYSLLHNL